MRASRRRHPSPESTAAPAAEWPARLYPTDDGASLPAAETARFKHRLHLHAEVLAALREHPGLAPRLALVMVQLVAAGRPNVALDSAGGIWHRTPLGGEHRVHYYLWWRRGAARWRFSGERSDDIVLRSLGPADRPPSAETPVTEGSWTVVQEPVGLERVAGAPWTAAQLDFAMSPSPVRFVQGPSGAGKTTALHLAVDAHRDERVLYLTWSGALVAAAQDHFAAFCPRSTTVYASTFRDFVELAAGRPTRSPRRDAAVAEIRRHLEASPDQELMFLQSELRGVFYGRAVPALFDRSVPDDPAPLEELPALSVSDYRRERGPAWRRDPVALRRIAEHLSGVSPAVAVDAFPDLAAAHLAARRLRAGVVPPLLRGVDRIVIDELQELSLVELWLVVELFRLMESRGRTPRLLAAGDDTQILRPSAFEWSITSAAVAVGLGLAPDSVTLGSSVRAPARLVGLLHRLTNPSSDEPDGDGSSPASPPAAAAAAAFQAVVMHVLVPDVEDVSAFVRRLVLDAGVAVIRPDPLPPSWLDAKTLALTVEPEHAKGLEYQAVCVLGLDHLLDFVDGVTDSSDGPAVVRVAVDAEVVIHRLNVVCSRAVETLILVDFGDRISVTLPTVLGRDSAVYSPAEAIALLLDDTPDPGDRARRCLDDAESLVDRSWSDAWLRAEQAFPLLGPPDLPGSVASGDARSAIRLRILALAALKLFEHCHEQVPPPELGLPFIVDLDVSPPGTDAGDVHSLERRIVMLLCPELIAVTPSAGFLRLLELLRVLEARVSPEAFWPRAALERWGPRLAPRLVECASDPEGAPLVNDWDARLWLRVLRADHEDSDIAVRAGGAAFKALMDRTRRGLSADERSRTLVHAETVLRRSVLPQLSVKASLLEERQRYREAAAWYRLAGDPGPEVRCLRQVGAWAEARELASASEGVEHDDLLWLADLETLASRRPDGLLARLTDFELDRLRRLLARV